MRFLTLFVLAAIVGLAASTPHFDRRHGRKENGLERSLNSLIGGARDNDTKYQKRWGPRDESDQDSDSDEDRKERRRPWGPGHKHERKEHKRREHERKEHERKEHGHRHKRPHPCPHFPPHLHPTTTAAPVATTEEGSTTIENQTPEPSTVAPTEQTTEQ